MDNMKDYRHIKLVTLCGSMRYADEMQRIATILELKNNWATIQCVYGAEALDATDLDCSRMDDLHKRKIDIADAIYVVNIDGYIGSSTRDEIEYAKAAGKEIYYHFAASEAL